MGRRKVGEERREQILVGFFKAMAKHGFHRCTMADVAREANISRGILHYHFKNKEEMFNEMVQMLERRQFEQYTAMLAEEGEPLARLARSLRFPIDHIGELYGWDLAGVWIELWGLADVFPRLHQFIRDLQVRLGGLWTQIIREGQEQGQFRADAPAETLAVNLLAVMEGLVLQWRFDKRRVDFPRQVQQHLEMLLAYLRPPAGVDRDSPPQP